MAARMIVLCLILLLPQCRMWPADADGGKSKAEHIRACYEAFYQSRASFACLEAIQLMACEIDQHHWQIKQFGRICQANRQSTEQPEASHSPAH